MYLRYRFEKNGKCFEQEITLTNWETDPGEPLRFRFYWLFVFVIDWGLIFIDFFYYEFT